MKLHVIFVLVLLFSGCSSVPEKQVVGLSYPMIMVMTTNQSGFYRCIVIKGPGGATLDWSVSPDGAISAKDAIQVSRRLSTNEFDALCGILESDTRLAQWKNVNNGNVTLDRGLLITLKPKGAFSEATILDIDPTPAASSLIDEIKEMLHYHEIEKLALNEKGA